ncbi:hypothetical protein RC62_2445 [Flavobacterium aquidurense]|uniref:Uncharacterized protein n=1 Tax=Flavobacterium aquidurense TaxID=362413 RepID=A0A0Q1BAA7_9FLAO|nr:hypothetical protein RC62_2445 [Flavobacterium aquidurense]
MENLRWFYVKRFIAVIIERYFSAIIPTAKSPQNPSIKKV